MTNLSNYFPGVEMKDVYRPTMGGWTGAVKSTKASVGSGSGNVVTIVMTIRIPRISGSTSVAIFNAGSGSAGQLVFGKGDTFATVEERNKIVFTVRDVGGTDICNIMTDSEVLDGNFHTILFAYDATAGTAVLIVDGRDADDTTFSTRVETTGTINTGSHTWALAGAWWASSNYLTGEVGFLGHDNQYITDSTLFFDSDNLPIYQHIDDWASTGWGTQPNIWSETGNLFDEHGSFGNFSAVPRTFSPAEIVRAGVVPGMMSPGESIALKLNNYMEMREAGNATRVDSHGELVLLDNGGTGVTQATGVNIGLATDFQNTTSAAAGVSNLTQAAETQLETAQGCFGIGCWIEPRNLDIGHQLFGRSDNASAAVNGWSLMIDASDKLSMTVVTGNVDYTATWPVAVDTSSTYFVWANYNKYTPFANGGLVSISVNGKPFVSTAVPGGIDNDGDTINVGRRTYAGSKYYYCGLMNRLIYTRAPLSLAETLWLYNNGLGRSYGAIMAYAL